MKLVIVSGLSGSGKSIALETLEDCGYYCIDNLPVALLESFVRQAMLTDQGTFQKTALGIDARNQSASLSQFPATRAMVAASGIDCELLFLQAEPFALLKRFSETRRKHPLTDATHSLSEAIELEWQLLEPVSQQADLLLDTTYTNVHQLRQLIRDRVGAREKRLMSLYFQSFGFKNGIPLDTDFVFDARCLPNPHWEPALRSKTGKDSEVIEFLSKNQDVCEYQDYLTSFLEKWVPRFEAENRSYLTIAVGCTGGQHRSVYLIEQLARHFRASPYDILVRHRELG
ncbi:RNase adapter RapZ [Methyloterricola oryzae]|uniref:RNase adapter RapZ n=1 Tax=Methyloterricola oryzae TaxID=1495050 RepID=UPI0005EAF702|nr:RNase adapter RapZ [Methyloterricola oryzae]